MIFARILVCGVVACVAMGFGVAPARAGVLYSQSTDITNPSSLPTTSQNDTSSSPGLGNFATAYDNFTLASGGSITSIDWTGSYLAGTFSGNPQGSITAFTLTIWGNDTSVPGGQPDTGNPPLEQVSTTSFNETSLGNDVGGDAVFTYSSAIPTFSAAAGTQYWLSIVPDLAFPIEWGWQSATTGGDGLGYQDSFGSRATLSNDFAFALNGPNASAVPEPASLALLLSGVAGFPMLRGLTRLRTRRSASGIRSSV